MRKEVRGQGVSYIGVEGGDEWVQKMRGRRFFKWPKMHDRSGTD